jgi:hypothetical protein
MPPRTTRKSYRPRVSDRTMVGTLQPPCLSVSDTEWRRHRRKMKPLGWKNKSTCRISRTSQISEASGQKKSFLHYVGWKVRKYPATGGVFFLDFPFYRTSRDLARHCQPSENRSLRSCYSFPTTMSHSLGRRRGQWMAMSKIESAGHARLETI